MQTIVDKVTFWSYSSRMKTISVSELKTHLSAELKRVQKGTILTVVDHKRPVATLAPIAIENIFVKEASCTYLYEPLSALIGGDPLDLLAEERKDSW